MKSHAPLTISLSKVALSIFLPLFLLIFMACASDSSDDDKAPEAGAGNTPEADVAVSIRALAADGSALESNDMDAESPGYAINVSQADTDGLFLLHLTPSPEAGVVRLSKPGYSDGLVYFNTMDQGTERFVTLKKRPVPVSVDGLAGGEFNLKDGAKVSIPEEALVDPDGNVVSGEVELYVDTVDIADDHDFRSFPGSFWGLAAADNEPGLLASLGVMSVDFYQNDRKLQLRDGLTAELTLPLYAAKHMDGSDIQPGDIIPLWVLNESSGIWEELGTGTVVALAGSPTGLGLQGQTTHFSAFNADVWGPNPTAPAGMSGPAGNPSNSPSICAVTAYVAEFEPGTRFGAQFVFAAFGFPRSSMPREDVYYDGIHFFAFRGYPTSITVWDREYNDGLGRSAATYFTCTSATHEVALSFTGAPVFTGWTVRNEPVLEKVDGQYTVTANKITYGGGFVRDKDRLVEVTSDLGFATTMGPNVMRTVDYLETDPSPVSFAAYLSNDEGTTDRLDSVEYINEQAPILRIAYAYQFNGKSRFTWDVTGADHVSIIQDFDAYLTVVSQTPDDSGGHETEAELPSGPYVLSFENQYGITSYSVALNSTTDNCIPGSDLPCNGPL